MCYTFHFTNKNYSRNVTELSIRSSSHRNVLWRLQLSLVPVIPSFLEEKIKSMCFLRFNFTYMSFD